MKDFHDKAQNTDTWVCYMKQLFIHFLINIDRPTIIILDKIILTHYEAKIKITSEQFTSSHR